MKNKYVRIVQVIFSMTSYYDVGNSKVAFSGSLESFEILMIWMYRNCGRLS